MGNVCWALGRKVAFVRSLFR